MLKTYARGPVVDIRLAQCYVPGLYCVLRSLVLVFVMSRPWISQDMSILVTIGIILYIDRTFRRESIFDGSAITLTILAGHILNLLRIRETPIETIFVIVQPDKTTVLTNVALAVQWSFFLFSLLWIVDCGMTVKGGYGVKSTEMISLVMNSLLLSTVMHIHTNASTSNQTNTAIRSLSFVGLSIMWTYLIGVRNMVASLYNREDSKGSRYSSCHFPLVQPIIYCHVRFGVVLVMDHWLIALWVPLAIFCIILRLYNNNDFPIEDTHQDYYIDPEILRDPFSIISQSFNAPNTVLPTKQTIPAKFHELLDHSKHNQDNKSEIKSDETDANMMFQKAMASSKLPKN